jgi:hypothetical protein
MDPLSSTPIREFGLVTTIHILQGGEVIRSVEEYLKVEDRFSWVDKALLVSKILQLRRLTDESKRSVIAIYEESRLIKEFVNVEKEFTPLVYC